MKKYSFIIIALFLLGIYSLQAQLPEEALRYSRLSYTSGTARSSSMSGAFGALGGDFSSLSLNPAGLGIYKSSEISFTPGVVYAVSESNFLQNSRKDDISNFNISNLGIVLAFDATGNAASAGFQQFNMGIGMNRTNDFTRDVIMKGYNTSSSITSQWVDDMSVSLNSDGEPVINGADPYSSGLAWETYLIDYAVDDSGNPFLFSDMQGGEVEQTVRLNTSGYMNEFVISGGFNWDNQLYVGATLGIPYFDYYEDFSIVESDSKNVNDYFETMKYSTSLHTSGKGVNLKIGAIYKPLQWLRIGAALHTPTKYYLSDDYSASLSSVLDLDGNGNKTYSDDASSTFSYTLRTPMRFVGSLGFVIGQVGLVSVDYIYQDYSTAKYRNSSYSLDEVNGMINTNYGVGHVLNLGTEWVLGILRLRAGYGYETSPYTSTTINTGGSRNRISAGCGLKISKFAIDFGYAYNIEDIDFYPYDRYYITPSGNTYLTHNFQLSLAYRF